MQQKLLGLLGDGRLHSGNALAQALGVSRAAVWKQVAQLQKLGLQVQGQAGRKIIPTPRPGRAALLECPSEGVDRSTAPGGRGVLSRRAPAVGR